MRRLPPQGQQGLHHKQPNKRELILKAPPSTAKEIWGPPALCISQVTTVYHIVESFVHPVVSQFTTIFLIILLVLMQNENKWRKALTHKSINCSYE